MHGTRAIRHATCPVLTVGEVERRPKVAVSPSTHEVTA